MSALDRLPPERRAPKSGVVHPSEPADAPWRRPATEGDAAFCFAVFASSRPFGEDLAGLEPALRHSLLSLQFAGQQASYGSHHPAATVEIVRLASDDIGRVILDRAGEAWTVRDLAIVPEWRGLGFGTALLLGIAAEAEGNGRPLDLAVAVGNVGALRLYLGLGFAVVRATPTHRILRRVGAPP